MHKIRHASCDIGNVLHQGLDKVIVKSKKLENDILRYRKKTSVLFGESYILFWLESYISFWLESYISFWLENLFYCWLLPLVLVSVFKVRE